MPYNYNQYHALKNFKKSPRKRIVHTVDKDVSRNYFQAAVRNGNFKYIWGSVSLFKALPGGVQENIEELYNIKQDPYEQHPLSLEDNLSIVKSMRTIIRKETLNTKFPKQFKDVKAAFPGNNGGIFITSWC